MFDLERFIADCREIQDKGDNQPALRELLERAMEDPGAVLKALGEPTRAGLIPLYQSPNLTIVNLVWAPYMTNVPHEHRMWALIGMYTGREDNVFWRRLPEDASGRVEAAGAKSLCVKDCTPLGREIIHSVTNPLPRRSAGIHIYGGDFFNAARSEWDPETLLERPRDPARSRLRYEQFDRAFAAP
jgi:predicted metal-dependent enzyme (double-stranded beta helix superfamily)